MLQDLSALVANVIFIIFLTTVVDLLLPGSQMKNFVRLVMGLFVIMTLLEPIGRILQSDALLGWHLPGEGVLNQESVMAQSELYQTYLDEQAIAQYEIRLSQQIKGLLSLIAEIEQCEVQVAVQGEQAPGGLGQLEQVNLWLRVAALTEKEALEEKVANLLTNYYGLAKEQLAIRWQEGDEDNGAR